MVISEKMGRWVKVQRLEKGKHESLLLQGEGRRSKGTPGNTMLEEAACGPEDRIIIQVGKTV